MPQIKVLIADGDPRYRKALAFHLRDVFEVDFAGNVKRTIELLRKSNGTYDVVILDPITLEKKKVSISHPAVPLIKQIRAFFPDVQIILLTRADDMDIAPEALAQAIGGVFRYMTKPCSITQLIVNIQAAVDTRILKKQLDEPVPVNIKILFLAANPIDSVRLRLDEEIREIDLALRQTEFRDRFDIQQHWAVRTTDLQGYLLRHKPNIVHFSGHGSPSSEIMLEDFSGKSRSISVRALSNLFSILKDNIQCVILNACYSEKQAVAISEHVDCVIGMSKSIGDLSAISFAKSFYQALGYGKDVQTAFNLGCMQIDLENLGEQDIPKLLIRRKDLKHSLSFSNNTLNKARTNK